MRRTVPLKLYIYAFTQRRKGSPGNLLIPSKRPTDLYLSLTMTNKIIGGCVRTPCPDTFL